MAITLPTLTSYLDLGVGEVNLNVGGKLNTGETLSSATVQSGDTDSATVSSATVSSTTATFTVTVAAATINTVVPIYVLAVGDQGTKKTWVLEQPIVPWLEE